LKSYARLMLLLIVLALSVGMLSTAINILGDITRLDLDEDRPGPVNPMMEPGSLGKSTESTKVDEEEPRELGPIMEIRLPTYTKYLRRYPAENYTGGRWIEATRYPSASYSGEIIPSEYGDSVSYSYKQFYVTPLTTFMGYIPVAPNTQTLMINTSVAYIPETQSFMSLGTFDIPYWVGWRMPGYSQAALRSANPLGTGMMIDVPDSIEPRLVTLAQQITTGYMTPYDKYRAIEAYLKENYRFKKDYTPAPSSIDPVIWFLFNTHEGVGSHFNSAFILLARSIGLPARAVIGFMIDPYNEIQYVMPQQAYLYAEAEFQGQGWVIFDAGPKHYSEGDVNITRQQTATNITGNDPVALKGKKFSVWGTVVTVNGTQVSGPQVEIIVKADKEDTNETGLVVGVGSVENGLFNVSCDATKEMEVGDYDLIAHTLSNRDYKESYSDPPITVMSETAVKITGPKQVYSGKSITYRGTITELSSGQPVANASLEVTFLDKTLELRSDDSGRVQYEVLFPENGEENITLTMDGTRFYVGSATSFGVSILIPPPNPTDLLSILLGFPQNIIIALSGAMGVGIYAARRNRRMKEEEFLEPRVSLPPGREKIGYEDGAPLDYGSYEEGVVKLFNRFYVSMQRIYPDIDDTMTPREFERNLIDRLPDNAHLALEDLVTSYEIAMYSNISVTEEDFKRTNATVELIIELMRNERREP
jgi:transglutaminase-like putative cysteine protease